MLFEIDNLDLDRATSYIFVALTRVSRLGSKS